MNSPPLGSLEMAMRKTRGIVFFIHVVENDVELLLFFGEQFERIAGFQGDTVADTCTLKIFASTSGVIRVAVRVNNLAALGDGASPSDGRVPDR
jgi:hypothetical protein